MPEGRQRLPGCYEMFGDDAKIAAQALELAPLYARIKSVAGRAAPIPKFVITRADNCVNCGKCEKACPVDAIIGARYRFDGNWVLYGGVLRRGSG
mgnify:CR=1 FL=1